jgi:putative DNA primase/helicase
MNGVVSWSGPPNRVVKATEEYLSAEDAVAQWLEDRCNVGISHKADLGTLFMSWCQWCEANGEQAGTNKRFAQRLEDRGFQRFRTGKARGFHGLCPAPVGDDTTWK